MGGSGKGGGGSRVPPPLANYPAYKAGEIGESMWNMTAPVRGHISEDWERFFNPAQGRQYDPAQLPAFSPLYNLARTGLEDQYSVAKENILSNMPRGGGMARQLGNLETGRAKDVGSLQSSISAPIISDMYNKAYNTGFVTGPATALAGLGLHATDTRSGMNAQLQAQMQSQAAANQGRTMKGAGIGGMLGKGLSAVMPGGGSILGTGISKLGGLGKGGGVAPGSFNSSLMMM